MAAPATKKTSDAVPSTYTLKESLIGHFLRDIATPAAVLDRAVVARNCKGMLQACEQLGVGFRSHVKSHKVVTVFFASLSSRSEILQQADCHLVSSRSMSRKVLGKRMRELRESLQILPIFKSKQAFKPDFSSETSLSLSLSLSLCITLSSPERHINLQFPIMKSSVFCILRFHLKLHID